MATETLAADGAYTLSELQTAIGHQEEIFGPLISLGNNGTKTVYSLEVTTSPAKRIVLKAFESAQPDPVAGHTLACHGLCIVENTPKKVAAWRPD